MSVRTSFADNRPSWHNPRILVVLLTVFLCGAATGALLVRLGSAVVPRAAAPAWKEGARTLTLERMKKDLELTPEQAVQIETVLDEFVLYYQNLQGQMDDFRADGKNRILRVLDERQKARFEKMMLGLSAKLR